MAAWIQETGHYVRPGEIIVVTASPTRVLLVQGTSDSFRILNPFDEDTLRHLPPQLIDPHDMVVTRPEKAGGRPEDSLTIIPHHYR